MTPRGNPYDKREVARRTDALRKRLQLAMGAAMFVCQPLSARLPRYTCGVMASEAGRARGTSKADWGSRAVVHNPCGACSIGARHKAGKPVSDKAIARLWRYRASRRKAGR